MKKSTKILLTVALAMVLVGGGLSATAWLVSGGNIGVNWKQGEGMVPTGKLTTNSVTLEAFTRLDIDTDYGDVELIPGGSEYRIDYAVVTSLPAPEISEENGLLRVENHADIMESGFFGVSSGRLYSNCYFRIYYPETANLTELLLDSGMGDIEAAGVTVNGGIEVFNAMGDIDLQRVKADTVSIEASMGEIDCEEMQAGSLDVTNSMGDVDVENATLGALEVELSMGDCNLSGKLTGEMNVQNDMGDVDIEIDGAKADYYVELDTNMGEKRLNGSKYHSSDAGNEDAVNRIVASSDMGKVSVDFQR